MNSGESGGNGGSGGTRCRIDIQASCGGSAPDGRDTQAVITGLVTNFGGYFGRAAGSLGRKLQFDDETRRTFIGLGLLLQILIEGFLGSSLKHPALFDRRIGRHFDAGRDSPRGGHRIHMPTWVDSTFETGQDFGSRRGRRRLQRERPFNLIRRSGANAGTSAQRANGNDQFRMRRARQPIGATRFRYVKRLTLLLEELGSHANRILDGVAVDTRLRADDAVYRALPAAARRQYSESICGRWLALKS